MQELPAGRLRRYCDPARLGFASTEEVALLAGTPAGERRADGTFSEGSVNRLIDDRLHAMAEAARRLHGGPALDGAAERLSTG